MDNRAHLQRLVDRYLDNQATADEFEVFVHLQKQGLLDEILNEQLDLRIYSREEGTRKSGMKREMWIVVAATHILVSGLLFYLTIPRQSSVEKLAITQVITGNREIKKVQLSEGTLITLNRNSTIRFAEEWNGEERVVELLRGEAFFNVQKTNNRQLFVVKTASGAEIKVLGTEFNVSGSSGETLVYLHEGSVKLQALKETVLLVPGELAKYSKNKDNIDIHSVDGDRLLGWKNNLFVFEDAGLKVVAQELEDYFGIKIELPVKEYGHLRFTGKISRENLNTVLAVISETLNLKVTRKGPKVKFQIQR